MAEISLEEIEAQLTDAFKRAVSSASYNPEQWSAVGTIGNALVSVKKERREQAQAPKKIV